MKMLCLTFTDGKTYGIPVDIIAKTRAEYYFNETDEFATMQDSLDETYSYFEEDEWNIEDWARGNMDWIDVEPYAKLVDIADIEVNYHFEWMEVDMEVRDL